MSDNKLEGSDNLNLCKNFLFNLKNYNIQFKATTLKKYYHSRDQIQTLNKLLYL